MEKVLKEYNYYDYETNKYININYSIYKKDLQDKDYIETLVIEGNEIDVFDNDYGQCYYLKYTDADQKIKEWGCGTFNPDYLDEAVAISFSINKKVAKNKCNK